MAIFSSMVLLASAALNQGLRQYQGLMEKGLDFWRYARYFWIERSFDSATDYYVYTKEDGWAPYFLGNQEGISYVSLSPLAGDLPVVVWIRNEREEGGKRSLVYYELPVFAKSYQEIDRDYAFGDYKKGNSFKLLEGVEGVEFSFYGHDLTRRKDLWYGDYDGRRRKLLPSLVKVTFSQDGRKGGFVFGMNVNSTIKMNYNEFFQR